MPRPSGTKSSDRPPLMQRLEKCQQQGVAVWTADAGEFRKNAEKLEREAETDGRPGRSDPREGFEFSTTKPTSATPSKCGTRANRVAEAVKQKNYEQARQASGDIGKACSRCHEGYRS